MKNIKHEFTKTSQELEECEDHARAQYFEEIEHKKSKIESLQEEKKGIEEAKQQQIQLKKIKKELKRKQEEYLRLKAVFGVRGVQTLKDDILDKLNPTLELQKQREFDVRNLINELNYLLSRKTEVDRIYEEVVTEFG